MKRSKLPNNGQSNQILIKKLKFRPFTDPNQCKYRYSNNEPVGMKELKFDKQYLDVKLLKQ